MDNQKKIITELTLDQMARVSGGVGEYPAPSDPWGRTAIIPEVFPAAKNVPLTPMENIIG